MGAACRRRSIPRLALEPPRQMRAHFACHLLALLIPADSFSTRLASSSSPPGSTRTTRARRPSMALAGRAEGEVRRRPRQSHCRRPRPTQRAALAGYRGPRAARSSACRGVAIGASSGFTGRRPVARCSLAVRGVSAGCQAVRPSCALRFGLGVVPCLIYALRCMASVRFVRPLVRVSACRLACASAIAARSALQQRGRTLNREEARRWKGIRATAVRGAADRVPWGGDVARCCAAAGPWCGGRVADCWSRAATDLRCVTGALARLDR